MSEAMNEVYRQGYEEFPLEMVDLLFPKTKTKSVDDRSKEAVRRIFAAVDAARKEQQA